MPGSAEARQARRTIAALVLPLVGTLVATGLGFTRGVSSAALTVAAILYVLTMLGVTMGFHRLFAHRSFHAVGWLRGLLAALGSMAAQGPVLFWAATHRSHHEHSDVDGDPHTPHGHGARARGRGWWHAHVGWMVALDAASATDSMRLIPDLLRDRRLVFHSRRYPLYVAAGVALPAIVGGLWTWSGYGALECALWGGPARIFASQHATWAVNSFAHMYGRRPFRTSDRSANNPWVAALSLGEGWHNNHHAFPFSAHHGLRRWEVDVTAAVIQCCARLGLVTDVKRPTASLISSKRA